MTKIEVQGMSCGGCVSSVSKIIHRSGGFGLDEIQVDLDTKLAEFPKTDDATLDDILGKLSSAGFPSKRQGSQS